MNEYLVIRLDDTDPATAQWVLVNDLGAQLARPRSGDLSAAAELAHGRNIIGLVPSMHVLRTSVDLPIRSIGKLLQALPFAMEDQLAEDVEVLHFAVGHRDHQGEIPVAVIRKDKMSDWTHQFREAGLDLAGLYSEGEALGAIPGTAILLLEDRCATLREPEGAVATVDHAGLRPMLELWLASRKAETDDDTPGSAVNLLVYISGEAGGEHAALLNWLRDQVDALDEKILPEGPLPRMAAQVATTPGINLLQGLYAPRSNFAVFWPAWRVAAILLLCLLGAVLGVKGAQLIHFNRQAETLDAAIERAFRFTFPEVREIRDPRSLLDSKLRALRTSGVQGAGSTRFLDTLQVVAQSVTATGDAELEAINYRAGVMDLRIRTNNVEVLDRIQKSVSKDGALHAEIQSANADGEQVLGRLQIKTPEA